MDRDKSRADSARLDKTEDITMTDTGREGVQRPLFYILVLTAGYLAYLILSPFLKPLAWAGVFAIMLQRPQQKLSSRMGANRAALVTTLLAAVLIVAPGITLVAMLANEVPEVNTYVQQASLTAPRRVEQIWQAVRSRSPIPLPENPAALVREGVRRALTFLAPRAGAVVADLVATLGSLAVMLFTLFFMLRDGHVMSRHLRDLLPLPPRQSERLMTETRDLVIASVGASLLVSAAQGAIAGLAFWLLGMNAPALWGVMTAFCSLFRSSAPHSCGYRPRSGCCCRAKWPAASSCCSSASSASAWPTTSCVRSC